MDQETRNLLEQYRDTPPTKIRTYHVIDGEVFLVTRTNTGSNKLTSLKTPKPKPTQNQSPRSYLARTATREANIKDVLEAWGDKSFIRAGGHARNGGFYSPEFIQFLIDHPAPLRHKDEAFGFGYNTCSQLVARSKNASQPKSTSPSEPPQDPES